MRSVNVLIEINYWLNSFLASLSGAAVIVTPLLDPHNQYNAAIYWIFIPLFVFCASCAFLAGFARRATAAHHETLTSAEEHINELRADARDTNRQLIAHKWLASLRDNQLEHHQKLFQKIQHDPHVQELLAQPTQLTYEEQVANLAEWCAERSTVCSGERLDK